MGFGTTQDFINYAESLVGKTPYVYGGTTPAGVDCSGLVYWAAGECGVQVPRTTQGEWAGLNPVTNPIPGDLILFDVPSDGPPQPQHVGIYLGPNLMVSAPHTGLYVMYSTIPNIPGSITIMGYRRILDFAGEFAPPNPTPNLPIPAHTENRMDCQDPTTGGIWIVDPSDGHVETLFGAPYLQALNDPPDRYNWQQVGTITGIEPWKDGNGNWGYAIIVRHTQPYGNGAYYSAYTFPRS